MAASDAGTTRNDATVTGSDQGSSPTGEVGSGQSRPQQVVVAGAIALVIILGAFWLAQSQGMGDLGDGGVNSSLLPGVGEPAPEFMTLYAGGEVLRLSELKGQPVWLNFWGSWCPPCRAEMPELQEAWEQLEPRGMTMIGVSIKEDPKVSVAYAEKSGATFPIAVDPNFLASVADPEAFPDLFETAKTWEIRNYPTHVFIDSDGIVRAVVLAPLDTECAIAYSELAMGESDSVPRSCKAG